MSENETENNVEKEEKFEPLHGYSTNKPVYLVLVQGYEEHAFVTSKLELSDTYVRITGHTIPYNSIREIKTLEDAEKHAEREEILDIMYPWHRVVSIRNITYKSK